jgi:murein DD-endopeptidase MepM/ murein hydrolase activator NlpD
MVGNDLPIELALELSEIYAWTIDFFGLQKGDSIRVYYDEQYVDSTRVGIGRIYAADFYHGRKWLEAFYFEAGDVHSYFDGDGKSLRKAFLKAPLNYKRISSHFTYARKHPIYKTVRPHTGVDYAAPAGTPVVSIGDGVVIEKGYKGGGGNTVKIKHNSTYTTAYLHLQKYGPGIAVGTRVSQGQVIGYVGSTGASTGPHLDFRVWKNGTPVDPLKMESPPVEPVPTKYRPEFDSIVTIMRGELIKQ